MKPTKTKRDLRDELNREIEQFVASGGEVKRVDQGISGNLSNKNLFTFAGSESNIKTDRTPLTEVVKDLERRKRGGASATIKKKPSRPEKKLLLDDFGEPIRWVWVEHPDKN